MLAKEIIDPLEADIVDRLIEDNLQTVGDRKGVARRGQHAKHHALVDGEFTIADDLPEIFRKGVFQHGKSYACRVRFSNGGQWDDRKTDVRGMAIKLLNVDGLKLLPGDGDTSQHDFLLVDHPTYFSATLGEYTIFNRNFTPVQSLKARGVSPMRVWRAASGLFRMLVFHRQHLLRARRFAGRKGQTLASLTYNSTTPYLFGDGLAVKYKAIGLSENQGQAESGNGLALELWEQLGEGPVTFEFGVVVQSDAEAHPIENPTIDWEANGAKFQPLARLVLHPQVNTSEKSEMAETSDFSPWRCLSEHRPIGAINRTRLRIYQAMLEKRRRANE